MTIITKYRCESVDGISIDILKSALQKALRRNDKKVGFDVLYLVTKFKGHDNGQKIITNFVNRLIVMMSEEISINSYYLPVKMKELHEKYKNTQATEILYEMFLLLIEAKKCRLISDLKTVYNLPPYYLKDTIKLDALYIQLLKEFDCEFLKVTCDSEECLENIKKYLIEKDYKVFSYISLWFRLGGSITKVWKLLKTCQVNECLYYFYQKMSHKEKPIYMYHAILNVIHEKELCGSSCLEIPALPSQLIRDEKIVFPEYVYDIHTKEGKTRGQNRVVFAEEGSYVKDEEKRFKNENYREMYIRFKYILDECSDKPRLTIMEELSNTIKGQKLTGPNRRFVYIPLEGKLKGYVWKGPYKKDEMKVIILDFRNELFTLLKSDVIIGEKIKDYNGDIWYRYEVLGDLDSIEYSVGNNGLKILNRESIKQVQLHKLDIEKIQYYLFEKELINSYIDASIIGVGDLGPWNTLIYKDKAYIIDYEETRMKVWLNDICNIFTKKCGRYEKILSKFVEKKNNIIEHLDFLDKKINEMLKIYEKHEKVRNFNVGKSQLTWDPRERLKELREFLSKN